MRLFVQGVRNKELHITVLQSSIGMGEESMFASCFDEAGPQAALQGGCIMRVWMSLPQIHL